MPDDLNRRLRAIESSRDALAKLQAEGRDPDDIEYAVLASSIQTLEQLVRKDGGDPGAPTLRYGGINYFECAGIC